MYSSSQQTYYLRRKYINIDPISGYFKDVNIYKSTSNFEDEMKKYNIAYVFVDVDALDDKSKNIINDLLAKDSLKIIKESNSYLSTSRLFSRGVFHSTILYKVNI